MSEFKATTCCVGVFETDIEKGACAVAWLCIVLNTLLGFSLLIPANPEYDAPLGVFMFLFVPVYASILLAQRRHEPRLYLPYLLFELIDLVVHTVGMFVTLVDTIWAPQTKVDEFAREHPQFAQEHITTAYKLASAAGCAGQLAGLALGVWLYSIVWRAFQLMRRRPSAYRLSELSAAIAAV